MEGQTAGPHQRASSRGGLVVWGCTSGQCDSLPPSASVDLDAIAGEIPRLRGGPGDLMMDRVRVDSIGKFPWAQLPPNYRRILSGLNYGQIFDEFCSAQYVWPKAAKNSRLRAYIYIKMNPLRLLHLRAFVRSPVLPHPRFSLSLVTLS